MNNNQRFLYDPQFDSPAAAMAGLVSTETPAQEPAVAVASPAEPAPVETQAEPITPPQPAPIAEKPWQEVLKSQNPEAVFKELGVDYNTVNFAKEVLADQKMKGFYDTWKNQGNVTEYLEALTTDYKAMPAEEVMRRDLRSKFPEMSKEEFDILYEDRVIDRYKLDPEKYSEEEVNRGKILLKADSTQIRESLIAKQNEKLLSTPQAQTDPRLAEFETQQAQQAKAIEEYNNYLKTDKYFEDFRSTKTLTIGEGENAFKYAVSDPDKTLSWLTDPEALAKSFETNGQRDAAKKALIATFASDPYKFLEEHAKHYRSLGTANVVAEIQNASKPGPQAAASEAQPATAAEAMSRNGRWSTR